MYHDTYRIVSCVSRYVSYREPSVSLQPYICIKLGIVINNYPHLPLQLSDNKQGIKAINNCGSHGNKFCQIFSADFQQKSWNFLIFCLILTKFLPKCRAQNVDSKKGMALDKKGMAQRHSRDLEDARFGVLGRENSCSDAQFCQEMIPGTQDFFAVRRPKIPILTLALLFISSKNQLSPIKIRITQINGVVQMQIRHAIKFHASGV